MNRIYGWVPESYSIDEIRNHTRMPLALKNDIEAIYEEKCVQGGFRPDQGPCPYMNMIWLHCDGEDDPDIENIGPVTYTPFRGFPGYFYPYRNQRGYLSPIVMVQLKNPMPGVRSTLFRSNWQKLTKSIFQVLMNIECTAWARNIERNRLSRKGLVHFELIMD